MRWRHPKPTQITVDELVAHVVAEIAARNEPAANRAASIHGALTATGVMVERRRLARYQDPGPHPVPAPDELRALLKRHGKRVLGDDVHGHYTLIWQRHRDLPPLPPPA